MYQELESMKEIHEIREKLYEENKNLSMEDRIEKVHREADEFVKKYGIKLKTKAIK
jgi:hypothetical protein